MDNLAIYNQVRSVPAEACKTIQGGRLNGFTDINPMWRLKILTETFGPCGFGWWYEVTDKRIEEDIITKQKSAFVDILLYVKWQSEVSRPIPGTGGASFVSNTRSGPYMSDECFKMALTDAISVAAKALGVGADIYFSADRSKYSIPASPPAEPPPQSSDGMYKHREPNRFVCDQCGAVLVPYRDDQGREVPVRKHAEGSRAKFGRCLCLNCIQSGKERGA